MNAPVQRATGQNAHRGGIPVCEVRKHGEVHRERGHLGELRRPLARPDMARRTHDTYRDGDAQRDPGHARERAPRVHEQRSGEADGGAHCGVQTCFGAAFRVVFTGASKYAMVISFRRD